MVYGHIESTEDQELQVYQPHGGVDPEVIEAAHAGVTWREMLRATRNARRQLREELAAGFERCAVRQAIKDARTRTTGKRTLKALRNGYVRTAETAAE